MIKVTSNYQYRDLITWYDITEKEREDFDYLHVDERHRPRLFRYKGEVYDADEFFPLPNTMLNQTKWWDGYQNWTYFSGILIRYDSEFEQVCVGRFISS